MSYNDIRWRMAQTIFFLARTPLIRIPLSLFTREYNEVDTRCLGLVFPRLGFAMPIGLKRYDLILLVCARATRRKPAVAAQPRLLNE